MKQKPIFTHPIAYDVKDEWQNKEYGSWEDRNEPAEEHIYPLLCSMPQDKIVCYSKEEAALVLRSASYQTSWDSDDPVVVRLTRVAATITKKLTQLINS